MPETTTTRHHSGYSLLARAGTWLLAIGCFYLVYRRTEAAALRESQTVIEFITHFFRDADWALWIAVMIPYSLFFFVVDTHATWRVVRWFNNDRVRFGDVLPIRASAYILSLVNEQIGKGAMSLYLLRRYRVPVLEGISSMILLGIVEIYQLLLFSAVGVAMYYDLVIRASTALPLGTIFGTVYAVAFLYFPLHVAYFRGYLLPSSRLRDRAIFHALRRARLVDYALVLLFKAPNLIGAVIVYTVALSLFSVDVRLEQMVAFLPVIFIAAALPLPFHAGALLLWTVLFPQFPEVGVFSLVMHTFFVTFNALIGLVFLPTANRELFTKT